MGRWAPDRLPRYWVFRLRDVISSVGVESNKWGRFVFGFMNGCERVLKVLYFPNCLGWHLIKSFQLKVDIWLRGTLCQGRLDFRKVLHRQS